jgi:hypothetical protein
MSKPKVVVIPADATLYQRRQQINAFISQIRPLDLIVFRGSDLVSGLITKMEEHETGSMANVSHVEVAMSAEWCDVADLSSNNMYSWGSTLSGPLNDGPCSVSGKAVFGVQLRNLDELIESYLRNPAANVGVCRLIDSPILRRPDESAADYAVRCEQLRMAINEAYVAYGNTKYDANPLALFGAMFPELRSLRDFVNDEPDKLLFCSEFVAALYKKVGIINDATDGIIDGEIPDAKNVLPTDFLGTDADKNGIVRPICETTPMWIKN